MSDPYWLSDEGPLTPETRERLLAMCGKAVLRRVRLDDALNQYLDRAERGRAEAAEFLQGASLAWEQAITFRRPGADGSEGSYSRRKGIVSAF